MQLEVKVKYQGIDEKTGKDKKITDRYLIRDAVHYAECEDIVNDKIGFQNDIEIKAMSNTNYTDIQPNHGGGSWYKTTVKINDIDGKKISNKMLIQANTTKEVNDVVAFILKDLITDYTISSISETKIVEVIN